MVHEHRRITIVDIAKTLGISPKSVSFGLNDTGRLSSELRQKIKETAQRLGYRPNLAAKRLVTHGSYLIGALLPYTQASFTGKILDGLEAVMQREEIGLMLGNGGEDPAGVERGVKQMLQYGVSGLLIMPLVTNWKVYADLLADVDFPVVQIMNPQPQIGSHYVEVNNVLAANEAVQHLLRLGHKRIGFISCEHGDISMAQRTLGYRMAMEQSGLPFMPEWIEEIGCIDDSHDSICHLLDRCPELTALFCVCDKVALEALKILRERNINVPRDFSVMGFDDMDFASQQVVFPMTTVKQPQTQIGQIAGEMLLALLRGESVHSVSMGCEIVERKTTAPLVV